MTEYPYLDELLAKDKTKNARFAGQASYTHDEMLQLWHGDNDIEQLALSSP